LVAENTTTAELPPICHFQAARNRIFTCNQRKTIMKNIKTQLFAILISLSAAAAPAAETAQGTGKVFEGENYTVIRETLPKGKEIPRHNHPGHTLLVTQTKGRSVFLFDGGKRQELRPGSILKADGSEYVAIKITDDSELVIVLVKDGAR
jgi:putative cupin domain protein